MYSSCEVADGAVGEAHYIFYSMYCIHAEERSQITKGDLY